MSPARLSDELVVDMAPDGTIYGIELLNANEQLQHEGKGKLVVINEATGEQAELLLAVRCDHLETIGGTSDAPY